MSVRPGLLICGHGSRDTKAQELFHSWAKKLQRHTGFIHGETGFMEHASPSIADAARSLAAQGVKHILVISAFIMGARHAKEDIPAILRKLQHETLLEQVRFDYVEGIANHPLLLQAAAARIMEALHTALSPNRSHCHLLVVAHGSSDARANADIVCLAEKLRQQFGFGACTACFSNICSPRVEETLSRMDTKNLQTLVILPYFLLASDPVRQLYSQAHQFAAQHPHLQVLKADCLKDHPLVLDVFVEALQKTLKQSTQYHG